MQDLISKALESDERIPATGLLEVMSFYGLLATIAVFSIPHGAAGTWHRYLLILFVMAFAGFRTVDGLSRRSLKIAEFLLLLPLFCILALAFFQTIQWPGTTSAISADTYETIAFILIFGSLIVAAEILFFYTTTVHRLKCVIIMVIAVAAGSSVFGLLRGVFFDSHSDVLAAHLFPEQGFAQFINRNHFALLIEMGFGLLLGLLIKGELSQKLKLICWLLAGVMGYSVIAANSRGGLVSFAALILFAVLVHILTRDGLTASKRNEHTDSVRTRSLLHKISVAACLMVLVFGLIVFVTAFVGGDKVITRMEKLKGEFETVDNGEVNRRLIWNSTLKMIESEPVLGVGFGGYAAAIPKFDTSNGKYRLQQAHNEYLEVLSNGGIIGFALFGLFGWLVVRRTSRNLRSGDPLPRASCFGAAIGIFGVLIHSLVDFGLHIPINAFIFAVLVVIATVTVPASSENKVAR